MILCWKYLVPIGFVNLIGTAIWMVVWPQGNRMVQYAMVILAAAVLIQFFRRVLFHLRRARPELYYSPAI
jgi:hypothetical protein